MAYELDQFIADCRSSLKSDPGPAGREQVRANLEKLLHNRSLRVRKNTAAKTSSAA